MEIYNYYIENTVITFEDTKIDAGEIERRIKHVQEKQFPFIIYEEKGRLLGYAYLDNWRSRPAYNITLETSIYMDINSIGKGIGTVLYKELVNESKKMDIHSLIGVISLPNEPSRKLHRQLGFQLIGNFKESGLKFNRLIDVEFWQLML
jgi:phosphinothricin acetyltransferase